jgi:hypothetical protein
MYTREFAERSANGSGTVAAVDALGIEDDVTLAL